MLKQVAIASREIACYKNEVYCVFSIEVMTYGYHVYQDGWDAILGEELSSKRELGNHKYHCTCGSGEITSYHHSFQMKKKKKNCSKTACMGDNSITKTTHKTTHSMSSRT